MGKKCQKKEFTRFRDSKETTLNRKSLFKFSQCFRRKILHDMKRAPF